MFRSTAESILTVGKVNRKISALLGFFCSPGLPPVSPVFRTQFMTAHTFRNHLPFLGVRCPARNVSVTLGNSTLFGIAKHPPWKRERKIDFKSSREAFQKSICVGLARRSTLRRALPDCRDLIVCREHLPLCLHARRNRGHICWQSQRFYAAPQTPMLTLCLIPSQ